MARVEGELRAKGATTPDKRGARFVSALALVWPDGSEEVVEGRIEGTIVAPRGDKGFGYDPQFLPEGHARTFGEMSSEEKHGLPADGSRALSHRARAFQDLAKRCLSGE
jgi:XTP/dITP diphosphohydrolase